MAKWCDEGENRVANILFNATAVDATLYVGLYTNNSEPAESDTLASITLPVKSSLNYAQIALARGTWTVTTDTASYPQVTWTAQGGAWGNIYGYYISTSTDGTGKLMAVETFSDGPYNIGNGDSIKLTPKVTVA